MNYDVISFKVRIFICSNIIYYYEYNKTWIKKFNRLGEYCIAINRYNWLYYFAVVDITMRTLEIKTKNISIKSISKNNPIINIEMIKNSEGIKIKCNFVKVEIDTDDIIGLLCQIPRDEIENFLKLNI